MAKFQLWKKNEYGDNGIVASSQDYDVLVNRAKKAVTEDNFENALTYDEKLKNWESYFVEVLDEEGSVIKNALYAGKPNTKHMLYLVSDDKVQEIKLEETGVGLRFFIGREGSEKKGFKEMFAVTPKKQPITSINDHYLEGKMVYYIRSVK